MLTPLKRFYSFDGTEQVDTRYSEPDRYRHLLDIPAGETCIVQGGGYSYAPASLSATGRIIRSKHFNRILAFDESKRRVTLEGGMTVGSLFDFLRPYGLALSILPGYPEITVGGCIATNIHGKNQFIDGVFSDVVERIKLFHPRHGLLNLSSLENTELLDITCGGYGLTGIIVEATLKLQAAKGSSVKLKKVSLKSNEDLLHKIREAAETADLIYTWQNFTSPKHFGSGFLYLGSYTNSSNRAGSPEPYRVLDADRRTRNPLPFFNYPSTRIFNAAYQWKELMSGNGTDLSLFEFSFPVVNKMIYFQLFGKQGFYEYQMIIPFDRFLPFCEELQHLLLKRKAPVTLASCKYFSGQQRFLHFTSDGICLAVDLPASQEARAIMAEIDTLLIAHQGLPNLGKDSRLPLAVAAETYREFDAFREVLRRFDPDGVFQSPLRKRLEL